MEAFHTGNVFWVLALTAPVLVVLLLLCIDCRDTELDTPSIDDYQYKPTTTARSQTFKLLRRPPSPPWTVIQPQPQSDLWRCLPQSLPHQAASFKVEGDNESTPSYENQVQGCITDEEDNDDNYVPPYIEVLPDAPLTDQDNMDCCSTDSIREQYENVLEPERHSPGEYVNVLDPEDTIVDICFGRTSDLESEDDTPDYENVCPEL